MNKDWIKIYKVSKNYLQYNYYAINKIFKNKIPKRIGHSFTSVFWSNCISTQSTVKTTAMCNDWNFIGK